MKNPYQNSIYNPCEECSYKKNNNHCMFQKRSMCAEFVLSQYIHMIEHERIRVPDKVLVALLRKNGWHGELRQEKVVSI